MENISDALKIAGAVMIFVIALTLVLSMFSKAQSASERILFEIDDSNYEEVIDTKRIASGNAYYKGNLIGTGRIVGIETIIPTLYRYYKENFVVRIVTNPNKDFPDNNTPTMLAPDRVNPLDKIVDLEDPSCKENFQFDLDKETLRMNSWVGNLEIDARKNLDLFVSGQKGQVNYNLVDYTGSNRNLSQYKNNKFIETFEEVITVEYENQKDFQTGVVNDKSQIHYVDSNGNKISIIEPTKKLIITYTMIK